ncbi:MAG: hypothetical protein KTR29_04985 [Rhodothermaceae bacterium]|nr:hypothetical protein [Rhodothermaceae bacterium]
MIIWDRLSTTSGLLFKATSESETGWNGEGRGIIQVEHPMDHVLLFSESGHWTPAGSTKIAFRNVFRWTLDPDQRSISLEHLRFGEDNPVFLFELRPTTPSFWGTVSPHLCGSDTYDAVLHITSTSLIMHWTIQGPAKNESLVYTYT